MRTNRFIAFILAFAMFVSAFCFPIDKNSLSIRADEVDSEMLLKEKSEQGEGIREFVTRMYRVCLDRTPDEEGLNGWTEKLINKEATGCSVAYGFIFSPEFQGKQATKAQYVAYMYDAFFGRKPDKDGFEYWVDLLDNGMEREDVFCGFANSQEFADLCEEYGVVRGYHISGTEYNKTALVNLFVERLYNVVLNRTCDQEGMAGWTTNLVNHTMSGGEVAYGFVFSPELLNKDLCNKHYTEILYEAFLGRSSDENGEAYWISKLVNGESRENVFNGFAGSVEFSVICESYGIEAGKVEVNGVTYGEGENCVMCEEENMPVPVPTATDGVTPTKAPGVSIGNNGSSDNDDASSGNGSSSSNNPSSTNGSSNNSGSSSNNGTSSGSGTEGGNGSEGGSGTEGGNGSEGGSGTEGGNGSSNPPVTEWTDFVTYEQFGAVGDGVTNDYNAIVAAHTYANENDLPVKAKDGAVYYVGNLNPNNTAGAIVTTDTDWTGAKFIIDDSLMSNTVNEREAFLFTIASKREMEEKWIVQSDDTRMIGLDPNLSSYPEYPTQIPVSQANSMLNRSFPAGTTKLEGDFGEQALYVLETPYFTRWGRRGYDNGRAQKEAIIVNSDGTINQTSPIEWPWEHIFIIKKFAIDENPLYIKGGSFTTIVNTLNTASGCYRGIHLTRSNTIIDGVEHYLTGEEVAPTAVYSNISYPTLGAPYGGFIRIENCAFITLRNLKTSAHKKSYIQGKSTAPYEIYAEFVCGINLENCTDVTDIMDKSRWGTFATNYCKSIVVDSCRFNRVDAHMGVYNITVKNSTLGYIGLLAVGFGNMNLENCTLYSNYLVGFRTDYGSAWYGDISIKNCTWKPNENSFYMFDAKFDTEFDYCYEHVDGYAVCMAEHINIDNLTVDLSAFTSPSLFTNKMNVFSITTNEKINGVMTEYNQAYLNSTRNLYPHRPPKEVNISNLTFIINSNLKANGKLDVVLRKDGSADFYKPTTLNYNPNTTQYIYSDGN